MNYTLIHKPVKVVAYFNGITLKPKYFFWKEQKYTVRKVTYTWHSYEGETKFLHFTVFDGINYFELKLNTQTMQWYLERVSIE